MKQILCALLFGVLPLLASAHEVSGRVVDTTGEPLPAANLFWVGTTQGTVTNLQGEFSLTCHPTIDLLVASYTGYENDTIHIPHTHTHKPLQIVLREGVALDELQVVSRQVTTGKLRSSVNNVDVISGAELCRAACCNLGESFVTNPSVDVSYTDAATGAKQIELLGLSGTYVQLLTENIPNYRGAAAPYALGYVPGPWMESIQVSKGISSVKNGYEALTGQINVEYKKPQAEDADYLSLNLFGSLSQRYEFNGDAAFHLSPKWSTMLLTHYENETAAHDANDDGFYDLPAVEQINLQNRWAYVGSNYQFQAAVKGLAENRISGQVAPTATLPLYEIAIRTQHLEASMKHAYIFNKATNTNIALIASASRHNQESHYGTKQYDVLQQNGYASLMFETELSHHHSLSTGLSLNYDSYDQHYRLQGENASLTPQLEKESVGGLYAQYTLNLHEKWVFMAGLRGDYSSLYGFFVTPRAHLKYAPSEYFNFRLSGGKGYRTNHILAENNYLLASSRQVRVDANLAQEEAWNYGASVATTIPLFNKTLTFNAEYFYTNFLNQVVVNMDSNPHEVHFANLHGNSFSHVFQGEISYPFFQGFTLTGAYRHTHVMTTYGGELREKPLTSNHKALLTASYQTPASTWQFDATLQQNGGGRMPDSYTLSDGTPSWEARFAPFQQLNFQVTRYFRNGSIYLGGENLTNFTQKNPIVGAENPWGDTFDATMVWGPIHGVKAYIGVRYTIPHR